MGCRTLAIRVGAVVCGALIGWSCAASSSTAPTESAGGGFAGSSSGATSGSSTGAGTGVATLCGDPTCPPLPGEDAAMDDVEAGRPVMDGESEASADDASMTDGAGQDQDASTDGPRTDSGGDGGSPDSEAAAD